MKTFFAALCLALLTSSATAQQGVVPALWKFANCGSGDSWNIYQYDDAFALIPASATNASGVAHYLQQGVQVEGNLYQFNATRYNGNTLEYAEEIWINLNTGVVSFADLSGNTYYTSRSCTFKNTSILRGLSGQG